MPFTFTTISLSVGIFPVSKLLSKRRFIFDVSANAKLRVGITASITIFLFAPNDPFSQGVGSVKIATFPEPSRIVPPDKVRASIFV